MTSVTPSNLGRHTVIANPHAACDTVTPVTAYMRGHAHARTHVYIQASHPSRVEHPINIKGLVL